MMGTAENEWLSQTAHCSWRPCRQWRAVDRLNNSTDRVPVCTSPLVSTSNLIVEREVDRNYGLPVK